MRSSFVFYESWWIAIKNLPRDVQGDVLTAIVEYGLSGETTEQLKPITKAILALVKPQIDVNNNKFENAKKGGRPTKDKTKEKPNGNQNETKEKPNGNQNETKEKPNGNQNETKEKPNGNLNEKCDMSNVTSLSRGIYNPPPENQFSIDELGKLMAQPSDWLRFQPENIFRQTRKVVSDEDVLRLIRDYVCKLKAEGVGYKSLEDAKSHFANWAIKIIKSNENGNNRANYTSKQEANDYAMQQYLADRERLEQGIYDEIQKPF